MDAAVAVDAQNAPTATWKTAQNAVSHSAHTHHWLGASHTEILTLPIGETNDLSAAHPELVRRVEQHLRAARTDSARWPVQ